MGTFFYIHPLISFGTAKCSSTLSFKLLKNDTAESFSVHTICFLVFLKSICYKTFDFFVIR